MGNTISRMGHSIRDFGNGYVGTQTAANAQNAQAAQRTARAEATERPRTFVINAAARPGFFGRAWTSICGLARGIYNFVYASVANCCYFLRHPIASLQAMYHYLMRACGRERTQVAAEAAAAAQAREAERARLRTQCLQRPEEVETILQASASWSRADQLEFAEAIQQAIDAHQRTQAEHRAAAERRRAEQAAQQAEAERQDEANRQAEVQRAAAATTTASRSAA